MCNRLACFSVVFLVVFATCYSAFAESVPRMSTDELNSRLGQTDLVVLDVRTGKDWNAAKSKIAGAVRLEPSAIDQWIGNYQKEQTIILYCA